MLENNLVAFDQDQDKQVTNQGTSHLAKGRQMDYYRFQIGNDSQHQDGEK